MSEALNRQLVVGAAADLLTTLTNFPAPSFSSSALGQRLRAPESSRQD
jgi:hypothetical protein